MPLEGHWQRQNTPLAALPRRDMRALIVGALAVVALIAIVLVGTVAGSTPRASAGCKRVTVAMTTGGASIERCGPGSH
jgi:hypothetical protein